MPTPKGYPAPPQDHHSLATARAALPPALRRANERFFWRANGPPNLPNTDASCVLTMHKSR